MNLKTQRFVGIKNLVPALTSQHFLSGRGRNMSAKRQAGITSYFLNITKHCLSYLSQFPINGSLRICHNPSTGENPSLSMSHESMLLEEDE